MKKDLLQNYISQIELLTNEQRIIDVWTVTRASVSHILEGRSDFSSKSDRLILEQIFYLVLYRKLIHKTI